KEFNNTLFQLHLQSDGERGSESSYYLDLRGNDNIRINRNNGGTFSNLKSESTSFSVEEDEWYNTVFRKDGNVLKAKAWIYGTEEPDEWQVEVEDDKFQKGYLGLGHVQNTAVNEYLFSSVGTNGENAPRAPQDILIDKQDLEAQIVEIKDENLDKSDYTEESWNNLQSALEHAEEVVNSADVTQEDVDEALEALIEAYDELEESSEETIRETLQEKMENIEEEDLDESLYTEDSWAALQTALKISEELLAMDEENVNDAVFEKALDNLGIAHEELKEK